ncbi:MAG: hypothetical protein ACFFB5_15210 [Promethearchaeota archaeon]
MDKEGFKEGIEEIIENATKKIFEEWEILDEIKGPNPETLEFLNNVDELIRKEAGINGGEIKIKKSIEKFVRSRRDLGEITIGSNIIKKIEIIDDYKEYNRSLRSIAYYQLIPVIDAKKPIVRILNWTVSHHPRWVIWFTSPIAKGIQARTGGEYLVAHSLNEKESEDYDLLKKFSKFPCFGRSDGIDILLSYETIDTAVKFVDKFLPTIMERNLYGDPDFLLFLQNYRQTMLELTDY